MEDKITHKQVTYISYLFNTLDVSKRSAFISTLTHIEEWRGVKNKMMCDVTQMKFEEWTNTLTERQGRNIIHLLITENVDLFKKMIKEYGYYEYARREFVRINGMVDETDYAYL